MLKGFSLVEVMISIVIVGILGLISVTIFNQTLKTSTNSEGLSRLKQNGEAAVGRMAEIIRNAEAVVCYGASTDNPAQNDKLVIRTTQGKFTKFRFVDHSPASGPITQNGYIAQQDNLDPALLSTFCGSGYSTSGEIPITNKDLTSGVSISNGEFIKLSGNSNRDTITIKFNVNPTKSAGSVGGTNTALIQTTVQVRGEYR